MLSRIKTVRKKFAISVIIFFVTLLMFVMSAYSHFNTGGWFQFSGFLSAALCVVFLCYSIMGMLNAFANGSKKIVFENPEKYYIYSGHNDTLRVYIENYLSDRAEARNKKLKKIAKISGRTSETYKVFERETIAHLIDDAHRMYQICLVVNTGSDGEIYKNPITAIFRAAIETNYPKGCRDRIIISKESVEIAKELML